MASLMKIRGPAMKVWNIGVSTLQQESGVWQNNGGLQLNYGVSHVILQHKFGGLKWKYVVSNENTGVSNENLGTSMGVSGEWGLQLHDYDFYADSYYITIWSEKNPSYLHG